MYKTVLSTFLLIAVYTIAVSPTQARSRRPVMDANGNSAVALVKSSNGVAVRVAVSARDKLQCVIDYVEAHGVHIVSMRGIGKGTVGGSFHPSGQALDINQDHRNFTHPYVPHEVSTAAADHCGVVSGARWHSADNGHWNLNVAHVRIRHTHRLVRALEAEERVTR